MELSDFKKLDLLKRLEKKEMFNATPPDDIAEDSDISVLEEKIGVKLSEKYKQFLVNFGGGSYGLVVIFSADKNSEWYLPAQLEKSKSYLPENCLPISDDFSGGFFCQLLENSCALEEIYYWNFDGGFLKTEYPDIFTFVGEAAY